jgi:hypothetical protein
LDADTMDALKLASALVARRRSVDRLLLTLASMPTARVCSAATLDATLPSTDTARSCSVVTLVAMLLWVAMALLSSDEVVFSELYTDVICE